MGKWEMISLGSAGEFASKSHIKAGAGKDDGEYKFFTSSNEQSKFLDEYLYDFPALIFGTGGNASVHYCDTPFSTSTDCLVFYSKNPKINLKMIYGFLSGNMHLLKEGFKGAGLKHISKKYLSDNIFVPKFEVNEQIYISDVLDRANALVEKRKAQIEKLDLLIKSQFIKMFGDPVTNPKGWEMPEINGICNTIVDCPHSTPNYVSDNTGYACLRTSVLKNYRIDWDKVEYISFRQYTERTKRYVPQQNDIVYSREGAILGIAAVINKKRDVALGQRMMLFSVDSKQCHFLYLWFILNMQGVTQQVQDKIGGSASPHINVKDIKAFKIPLPPFPVQNQFAVFVQQVEAQKSLLQQSTDKLELNYNSLMQKCFRGELF